MKVSQTSATLGLPNEARFKNIYNPVSSPCMIWEFEYEKSQFQAKSENTKDRISIISEIEECQETTL